MAAWWDDALQHWCALVGLSAEVRYRDPLRGTAVSARETGTWWIPPDYPSTDTCCCVGLDPTAYAYFPSAVDKPQQDALTWMLRTAFATRGSSSPITPAARLAHWATRPNADLITALAGSPTAPVGPSLAGHGQDASTPPQLARHRGYLLWLQFPTVICLESAPSTPPAANREFARTVEDVIEAFDPGSWREWLAAAQAGEFPQAGGPPGAAWSPDAGAPPDASGSLGARESSESGGSLKVARSRAGSTSLLLFVSEPALADYAARDDGQASEPEASPSRPGDLYLPQLRDVIRGFAADLMQMMEADALTSCTIAISQLLPRHGARQQVLDAALASLVLAHRARGVGLRRDRVMQYGEDALVHLVQALSPAGHEVIRRLSPAPAGGPLPNHADETPSHAADTLADLPETLQAMVAANLNVSEAARLLFVHRNTLQGRIERVREGTGRDLRNFDDAVSLRITLLSDRASHTPRT